MRMLVLIALASVTEQAAAQALGTNRAVRLNERARQDREIVYFRQQPETHAFDLYHDYTESRPGVDRYLNIVRGGSRVSNPAARILDLVRRSRCKRCAAARSQRRRSTSAKLYGPSPRSC